MGRKIYINPDADLSVYNKVVIDPVSFEYYKSALEITPEEKERLARYLKRMVEPQAEGSLPQGSPQPGPRRFGCVPPSLT